MSITQNQTNEIKMWVMKPTSSKIRAIPYNDENVTSQFQRNIDYRKFPITADYNEYFIVFFDDDKWGAYNKTATCISHFCNIINPTGNFLIIRKKWVNGEITTVDMGVSPKEFRKIISKK